MAWSALAAKGLATAIRGRGRTINRARAATSVTRASVARATSADFAANSLLSPARSAAVAIAAITEMLCHVRPAAFGVLKIASPQMPDARGRAIAGARTIDVTVAIGRHRCGGGSGVGDRPGF